MLGLCVLATALALVVLAWIFGYVLLQGARHVNLSLFVELPAPVGEPGGGFLNALVGTAIMVGVASAVSVPIGIFAGIYLAEFGLGWLPRIIRFVNDTLNATPSIVAGLFAYTLIVLQTQRFSAFAGSVALAVLMIPTITRTSEEMLRLVPRTLRDAALALEHRTGWLPSVFFGFRPPRCVAPPKMPPAFVVVAPCDTAKSLEILGPPTCSVL